jgi:hypothetical protein
MVWRDLVANSDQVAQDEEAGEEQERFHSIWPMYRSGGSPLIATSRLAVGQWRSIMTFA